MPYAAGLVCFGGEPAPVPETLIQGIQKTVDALTFYGKQWYDELQHGDTVVIQSGPFAGYQALFDTRISGTERVRLLLEAMRGQTIALILDAAHIGPTKRR